MGAYRFPRLLMVAVAIGVLLTCTQAWGATYTVNKNCAEFGHINQHSLDRFEGDWLGNVACAPTATMNSFIYLQNHYPGIYDNLLVPVGAGQDVIRARQLALQYMMITNQGTTIHHWAWGKYDYLENYAPGKTLYHGQTTYNGWTTGKPRPAWVQNVNPSWNFVYNQLLMCQDVEIGIWWSTDMGHALTVCGLSWDDVTMTGSISYLDPWDALCYNTVPLTFNYVTGKLYMPYGTNNAWIDLAFAESPVPEPSAFLALGSGFFGVLITLRRRRA